MSGGKSNDSQTVTSRTEVPPELRPLVRQSSQITGRALSGLERQLTGSPGSLNLPQGARVENGRVVRDVQSPSRFGGGKGGFNRTQTVDLGSVNDFRTPATGQPDLVAGFDPLEEQAMGLTEQRARGAGDFIPTFQNQVLSTAQGDFLHGGPGFNEALEAAKRRVMPQILSTFSRAGALNGGLAQEAIAQAISDSFAGLYNNERERQMRAISALPDAATVDASMLSDVGGTRRSMAQREIEAPITAMERLIAATQGIAPATHLFGQSETRPLFRNRMAGALGGGLSGLGLAQGWAGMTGGSLPAFSPLVSALGPTGGAFASFAIPGAVLGGLLS